MVGAGTAGERGGARFFRLVGWEVRQARVRRGPVFRIFFALLLALAGIFAAGFALLPAPELVAMVLKAVSVFLLISPMEGEAVRLSQLSTGYVALRTAEWLLVILVRMMAPALGAESVAGDRRSGRLEELQLVPFSPAEVYFSKVAAMVATLLKAGAVLLVPASAVALAEYVSPLEIAGVWLEFAAQAVLAASLVITLSALYRSPWAAQGVASLLLWLVLPACSVGLLVLQVPALTAGWDAWRLAAERAVPDALAGSRFFFGLGVFAASACVGMLGVNPQGFKGGVGELLHGVGSLRRAENRGGA